MTSKRTRMNLSLADVVTLKTAVSYLSETEGNGPDLDKLLDSLYVRLEKAQCILEDDES